MNQPVFATIFLAATALSALMPTVAMAEPTPPPFDMSEALAKPTLRFRPAPGITLGSLKLGFERTPLDQLRALVGTGEVSHRGDASQSTYWLCYTIESHPMAQRLWFIAGEMGGPEHLVSAIQATSLPAGDTATESCPLLPKRLQPIALSFGIWLGQPVSAVRKRLGKPSASTPGAGSLVPSVSYSYLGKVPGRYEGKQVKFDRVNHLRLTLEGGVVQGIVASQITSY